jgi:hypothetical protein
MFLTSLGENYFFKNLLAGSAVRFGASMRNESGVLQENFDGQWLTQPFDKLSRHWDFW